MSYRVKAVLGLALFVAGLAALEYAVYKLMYVGACPSTVADAPTTNCPPEPIETSLMIPAGLLLVSIGLALVARRGTSRGPSGDSPTTLAGAACLFVVTGAVALVAGLGSKGPGADSARSTGIFLAALFGALGAAMLFQAFGGGSGNSI